MNQKFNEEQSEAEGLFDIIDNETKIAMQTATSALAICIVASTGLFVAAYVLVGCGHYLATVMVGSWAALCSVETLKAYRRFVS